MDLEEGDSLSEDEDGSDTDSKRNDDANSRASRELSAQRARLLELLDDDHLEATNSFFDDLAAEDVVDVLEERILSGNSLGSDGEAVDLAADLLELSEGDMLALSRAVSILRYAQRTDTATEMVMSSLPAAVASGIARDPSFEEQMFLALDAVAALVAHELAALSMPVLFASRERVVFCSNSQHLSMDNVLASLARASQSLVQHPALYLTSDRFAEEHVVRLMYGCLFRDATEHVYVPVRDRAHLDQMRLAAVDTVASLEPCRKLRARQQCPAWTGELRSLRVRLLEPKYREAMTTMLGRYMSFGQQALCCADLVSRGAARLNEQKEAPSAAGGGDTDEHAMDEAETGRASEDTDNQHTMDENAGEQTKKHKQAAEAPALTAAELRDVTAKRARAVHESFAKEHFRTTVLSLLTSKMVAESQQVSAANGAVAVGGLTPLAGAWTVQQRIVSNALNLLSADHQSAGLNEQVRKMLLNSVGATDEHTSSALLAAPVGSAEVQGFPCSSCSHVSDVELVAAAAEAAGEAELAAREDKYGEDGLLQPVRFPCPNCDTPLDNMAAEEALIRYAHSLVTAENSELARCEACGRAVLLSHASRCDCGGFEADTEAQAEERRRSWIWLGRLADDWGMQRLAGVIHG